MPDEQDHLEYYIKFPTVKLATDHGTAKTPIVILFGWAGCNDKHLCKYSQIYDDKGFITLRYSAPLKFIFWQRSRLKPIGERLVKLLYDMNFENHPIIVHCFSNGGAFLLYNFLLALRQKSIQLKGVIFDSSPGYRRLVSLYKAISTIVGGNIFYNLFLSILISLFLVIIWQYEIIKGYFASDNYQSNPVKYLQIEDNKCPQYFIFSKADDLIYYKDVEEFMDLRRARGVDVSYLKLDDSPHLKHYLYYKKEYLDGVHGFLSKCFK
ncbi:hypothetical protein RN001_011145 [Aquatica leii]|uniref:Transmembrane protein 53 n=1 Tax=Aquatica leii TaxID=1421715 RepID=A0AAN7SGI5_9COLE|nr:hypothetical protein RN001_011145 [Aquatica leii]